MATALTRPVVRKIDGIERRGLVVTLYPNQTIGLRPARTRTEHVLPLARVYRWAVEATIAARTRRAAEDREARRLATGQAPRHHLVHRGLLR